MRYTPVLFIRFPDSLAINVPRDVRDALKRAAAARRLTVSDYARLALADRLIEDGEHFRQFPILSVDTLDTLTGGR